MLVLTGKAVINQSFGKATNIVECVATSNERSDLHQLIEASIPLVDAGCSKQIGSAKDLRRRGACTAVVKNKEQKKYLLIILQTSKAGRRCFKNVSGDPGAV